MHTKTILTMKQFATIPHGTWLETAHGDIGIKVGEALMMGSDFTQLDGEELEEHFPLTITEEQEEPEDF